MTTSSNPEIGSFSPRDLAAFHAGLWLALAL